MKADPTLNESEDAAFYGMVEKVPDKKLLEQFVTYHTETYLEL
jgi:hypothetical protein